MTWTLRDLEKLLEGAHAKGARAAEVLAVRGTTTSVVRYDRRNTVSQTEDDSAVLVHCWLADGRRGSVEGPGWEAIEGLFETALEQAEGATPNTHEGPVSRLGTPSRGLGIDDRRHGQLAREDRIDVVNSNEAAASRVDSRVRTGRFGYEDRREQRLLANSKGVGVEAWSTRYDAWGFVELRVPGGPHEFEARVAGRAFTSTACLPFGAALAKRAAALADETDPISGPVRVLMRSQPTSRLMAWLADRIVASEPTPFLEPGRQLFHRRIHLVDDGALAGGLRSFGFDDRGVLPVPLTLIREGVIDRRPIGVSEARASNTRPTGHFRDGRMQVTNLQLHSGMRSVNAHLGEQTGLVFEIDDFADLDGAIDPATGNLDIRVHGHVWDRQKRLGARRMARVTGNLVDVLGQVAAVASDTDRILHVDAPALFVDGFTVEG
jgi:predicted Zn-dependent protease